MLISTVMHSGIGSFIKDTLIEFLSYYLLKSCYATLHARLWHG